MTMINLPIVILWLFLGVVKMDSTNPSAAKPAAYHVFGGQPLQIAMAVEVQGDTPMEIQADLYQKGQSLLAPIRKDIVVAKTAKESQALRPLIPWTLSVPEVKRETQLLARLRVTDDGTKWTPLGEIAITAYPPDFAQEKLAALGKTPGLHIYGGTDQLRDFLKAQKVEFDDAGETLADLSTGDKGIYLGEATSRELTDWLTRHPEGQGNLVVFCTDTSLLPGVFVTTQGGYRIVKVTLPLLETLSSDPRSQKTLLEILSAPQP